MIYVTEMHLSEWDLLEPAMYFDDEGKHDSWSDWSLVRQREEGNDNWSAEW